MRQKIDRRLVARPRTEPARALALMLLAVLAVAALTVDAHAQDGVATWRSGKYGRAGAEVWAELPRLIVPTGKGYDDDYGIGSGLGFGFGVMFGLSDNLALEGRMLQTTHQTSDGRGWDLDQYFAGARYTFRHERAVQPFVALGGARLSMEWNVPEGGFSDFERLWGIGAYGSVGVDYVLSSRWVVGLRSDYVWMRYTRANIGTEESDIADPLDGTSIGLSLSLHYRVPMHW
ncbi:MAG: porin family protein [Candidatus Eisenbacteria bacterium]